MSKNEPEQPLSPSELEVSSSLQDGDSGAERSSYDLSAVSRDEVVEDPILSNASDESEELPPRSEEFESASNQRNSSSEELSAGDSTDYLEDDEEWAAAADQILHQSEDTVVAQQEDAVVSWDIKGLYDESGKVRGKRSLRNNPPMLVISDSNGDNAAFVLSKNLSGVLARHLDNTHRAYYGIRPKDELSFKEKLSDARTGLRENMGKTIVVGGLLLGLLIFGFIV